ncbi:hypothetical protein AB8O64_02555 [Streptomyces sp. QH1-20]
MANQFGAYPRTAVGAVLGGTGDFSCASGQVAETWPDADHVELIVQPVM